MKSGVVIAIAIVAGATAGCRGGLELSVDLKTDYAPGIEFESVRTEVLWGGGATSAEVGASVSQDFVSGIRIVEAADVEGGAVTVRVFLVGGDGSVVAQRSTVVDMSSNFGLTVLVTRACEGVVCPGPTDPAASTQCVGGACVEERCSPESPMYCAPPECTADTECTTTVACATGRCDSGVCLFRGDDALCAPGEYCNSGTGCRPVVPGTATTHAYLLRYGVNEISLLDVGADGELSIGATPTYAIGGEALFGVANTTGSPTLYVSVQDDRTIRSLSVDTITGELTQIDSDAAGALPWMIALHPSGNFLYVPEWGTTPNVHGFAIAADGSLTPIAGSPWTLPGGPGVIWIDIHPDGDFAVLAMDGDEVIAVPLDPTTGALAPPGSTPWDAMAVDAWVVLFAAGGTHGFVGPDLSGPVPGFTFDRSTGTLSTTPGSPFGSDSSVTFHATMDPARRRLYMANQGRGTFSTTAYLIDQTNGSLTHLAGSPADTPNTALSVSAHPANDDVYVVTNSAPVVVQYRATDTTFSLVRELDLSGITDGRQLVIVPSP